ncbi:MAG: hypothetical protein LBS50_09350 [Prevotellaceae bacterium]|nr:hypothetical protein [Prevotellaceae bacterium]
MYKKIKIEFDDKKKPLSIKMSMPITDYEARQIKEKGLTFYDDENKKLRETMQFITTHGSEIKKYDEKIVLVSNKKS